MCTCGAYMSVIPPEPCPIHDPERAYWRAKLLKEFPQYAKYTRYTTTGNFNPSTITWSNITTHGITWMPNDSTE